MVRSAVSPWKPITNLGRLPKLTICRYAIFFQLSGWKNGVTTLQKFQSHFPSFLNPMAKKINILQLHQNGAIFPLSFKEPFREACKIISFVKVMLPEMGLWFFQTLIKAFHVVPSFNIKMRFGKLRRESKQSSYPCTSLAQKNRTKYWQNELLGAFFCFRQNWNFIRR